MAPEYIIHGHFSVKSNVFSFGVLILEIVSGQKNSCFHDGENVEYLSSYAWKNWMEGTVSNLIDPTLKDSSTTKIWRRIHIGLLCLQESVGDRPTMASVISMLTSYSLTLPVPSQPAFFMHSTIKASSSSQQESSLGVVLAAANEASITELFPR
ncbi:cysteine-rich receptor-like protein kinase 44 [Alnus glutinosa]|uniref:cysteine-rich receptor-like protein kinase 44 n=1 Tax=Alnus glutinosa TaxID=3517 RepID=UPI002D790DB4|nr:cysteine-rich receptor-like protein kinase 44 [Alnus glutinosa]